MKYIYTSRSGKLFLLAAKLLLLSACAVLDPNFKTPTVTLASVQPLQTTGLEQRFNIGLRVNNPNQNALNLVGISYAIELEGFEVITGAANNVPVIPAYGDTLINIEAAVGFMQGVKFIGALLNKTSPELGYKIKANLDTGLPIIGILPITNSGVVNLSDALSR